MNSAPGANSALPVFSEKDVLVHTMPKRFLNSRPAAQSARGIGLIVLIAGLVVLAAALVFLYFYLARADESAPMVTPLEPSGAPDRTAAPPAAVEQPLIGREDEETAAETEVPARIETAEDITPATTTAPAAEEFATTTAETVDSENATTTRIINAGTSTPPAASAQTALDSDGDGLTDLEEVLLDTNIHAQDSDGDGHDDRTELMNYYNPAGSGSLIANPNIEKYISPTYNYVLYYPYVWPVETVGGDDSVIFTLGGNQFIQIVIQPNAEGKSLDEWYLEQFSLAVVPETARFYKKGWWSLKSEDNLTFYLARPDHDNIFIMTYSLGISNILQYPNIFNMMVKSFEIEN